MKKWMLLLLCAVLLSGCGKEAPASVIEPQEPDITIENEKPESDDKGITEGAIYEAVSACVDNATLVEADGSLGVRLSLINQIPFTSVADEFFGSASAIIGCADIQDEYSAVSFIGSVNDEMIAILTLTQYASPDDYTAVLYVLNDKYSEAFYKVYSESDFYNYDADKNLDDAVDGIIEKYK